MTLHWWMHWFWVTLLTILACTVLTQTAPQSEELQRITTDLEPDAQSRYSERQGRAMYFTKTQTISSTMKTILIPTTNVSITENNTKEMNESEPLLNQTSTKNVTDVISNSTEIVHPSILWTPVNSSEANNTMTKTEELPKNRSEPLNVTTTASAIENDTESSTAASKKRNNLTRLPEVIKEVDTSLEGASESRIVTEKPLSLETTYLQTRVPANIESSRRIIEQSSDEGGMDTGAIAGISFAALVLAALAGSTAFVLYRRRYLNKPQTLNDKCSNPDSSGYLDDSTIRDNSEEMYSLDNDSFLNSLEAMTIQNYWTDTVKHTKL